MGNLSRGSGVHLEKNCQKRGSISRRFRDVRCRYLTFLLPPVRVTLTKRRVYTSLFLARPLGTFFFSWGSTLGV